MVYCISNKGDKGFFIPGGKATDGGQHRNEFRNITWKTVSGLGVFFWENVFHAKVYYCIFLQNGGRTFLSFAQEFPAWPFLEGVSMVP